MGDQKVSNGWLLWRFVLFSTCAFFAYWLIAFVLAIAFALAIARGAITQHWLDDPVWHFALEAAPFVGGLMTAWFAVGRTTWRRWRRWAGSGD